MEHDDTHTQDPRGPHGGVLCATCGTEAPKGMRYWTVYDGDGTRRRLCNQCETAEEQIAVQQQQIQALRAERLAHLRHGGPAFPGVMNARGMHVEDPYVGMSLRDWFAGQALAGLCGGTTTATSTIVSEAYRVADAMLAARREEK